jgi:hypothetical protein
MWFSFARVRNMGSRHILVRDQSGMLRVLFWITRPARCCCCARWLANNSRSDDSKTCPARQGMGPVVNFQHLFCGDLGAALGSGKPLVAEQFLDGAQIRAFFQHVSSDS